MGMKHFPKISQRMVVLKLCRSEMAASLVPTWPHLFPRLLCQSWKVAGFHFVPAETEVSRLPAQYVLPVEVCQVLVHSCLQFFPSQLTDGARTPNCHQVDQNKSPPSPCRSLATIALECFQVILLLWTNTCNQAEVSCQLCWQRRILILFLIHCMTLQVITILARNGLRWGIGSCWLKSRMCLSHRRVAPSHWPSD